MLNLKYNYKLTLCILFTFFSNFGISQTVDWLWAKSSGGINNDGGFGITTDPYGNVVISGWFDCDSITFGNITLTNSFGSGQADFFLIKFDGSGNPLWGKNSGTIFDEKSTSVTTDALGNIYITGVYSGNVLIFGTDTLFNSNFFTVKYDGNGNEIWAKGFRKSHTVGPSLTDWVRSIKTDLFGNVYLCGYYYGDYLVFGSDTIYNYYPGSISDIFILKYDSLGIEQWIRSAGDDGNDKPNSIEVDNYGYIYMTGSFSSSVIYFDSIVLTNLSSQKMFLVKYDGNGNVIWAQTANGYNHISYGVAADNFGNLYISGNAASINFNSTSITGSFLAKFNNNGAFIWAKDSAQQNTATLNAVTTDSIGDIYVTGAFQYFTSDSITVTNSGYLSYTDILVVKYDSSGNTLWAKSGGSFIDDNSVAIAVDFDGGVYVCGDFAGDTLILGSSLMLNHGHTSINVSNDFFIAKIGQITSIAEIPESISNFAISPNPATKYFNIIFDGFIMSAFNSGSPLKLKMSDITGKKLYNEEFEINDKLTVRIDNLKSGIYFVTIESNSFIETKKILVVDEN